MKIVLFGATDEITEQVTRFTNEMIEEARESCYHLVCCDNFEDFMRQCIDEWERSVGLLCNWGTVEDLRKILQQFDRFLDRASIILLTELDWIREHGQECEGLVTDGILPLPLMSMEYKGCIEHYFTFHRSQEKQYLILRDDVEMVKVYMEEILYMKKVDGRYLFHLPYGEIHAVKKAKDIEERLDGRFVRCDTEMLVNLQWIQSIEKGNIVLRNGEKVSVNQKRRGEVDKLWQEYLAGGEVKMLTEKEIEEAEEERELERLLREQKASEMMLEELAVSDELIVENYFNTERSIEELFDKKIPR